MRTDSALPVRRSTRVTSNSVSPERSVPLHRTHDVPADTSATFSRVIAEYHLETTAIDAVIDRLPVSVLVAARNGAVVYANGAARLLGAGCLAPVRWALTRALLTEDRVVEEAYEHHEPGSPPRSFSLDVTPVRDSGGAVTAAVLTLTDVTAARQLTQWKPIVESLMRL